MCASALEELRRPGLSGGGGGKPLLAGLGGAATADCITAKADFLLGTFGAGLVTGRDLSGLAAAFGAALVTGLAEPFGVALLACFLAAAADGLMTALTGALEGLALTGDALTTGLAAGLLAAAFGLLTGLPPFLAAGLLGGLETTLGFATGFAVGLPTALPTDALADFGDTATFFALDAGLLAALFALADFAGFAFTACLL